MAICLKFSRCTGRADLFTRHILASIFRSHLGFQENWDCFIIHSYQVKELYTTLCCLHRVYKIFRCYSGAWQASIVTSIWAFSVTHGHNKQSTLNLQMHILRKEKKKKEVPEVRKEECKILVSNRQEKWIIPEFYRYHRYQTN